MALEPAATLRQGRGWLRSLPAWAQPGHTLGFLLLLARPPGVQPWEETQKAGLSSRCEKGAAPPARALSGSYGCKQPCTVLRLCRHELEGLSRSLIKLTYKCSWFPVAVSRWQRWGNVTGAPGPWRGAAGGSPRVLPSPLAALGAEQFISLLFTCKKTPGKCQPGIWGPHQKQAVLVQVLWNAVSPVCSCSSDCRGLCLCSADSQPLWGAVILLAEWY